MLNSACNPVGFKVLLDDTVNVFQWNPSSEVGSYRSTKKKGVVEMLEEPIRKMLKEHIGITDEDLDRMSPGMQKLMSIVPQVPKWRFIAEVTDSKYCFAGCKVGDKLVFQGPNLMAEESTCPLCVGAIAPVWERMHIMWDRMTEGRDPNESWLRYSQCTDAGLEPGGLGRVLFKVYAEKVEE